MNPSEKGEISEVMVLAQFVKSGTRVLRPYSASLRYDLVIEDGDGFHKVQCKTGRLKDGVVVAQVCSVSAPHRGGIKKGYKGEIDLFGIYCPETDEVYIVPVEDAPSREIRLRIEKTKNNQSSSVRWAKDYVLRP